MNGNCLHPSWRHYLDWNIRGTPYRAECETCGLLTNPRGTQTQVTLDINAHVIEAMQIRIATQKAMLETKPVWSLPASISKDILRNAGIDPDSDHWSEGIPHHELSVKLMKLIEEVDWTMFGDYFCWKTGGDGESLMYELDYIFELAEAERKKLCR